MDYDKDRARKMRAIFARNLDQAIDDESMTLMDVGIAAGMHPNMVSMYRRNTREPGIGKAAALARAVGRSLDELVSDPDARPSVRERVRAATEEGERARPEASRPSSPATEPSPDRSPETPHTR